MPLPWDAEEFKEPYPFKSGSEQQPQTTVTREVSLDIAIDANGKRSSWQGGNCAAINLVHTYIA